VTFADGTDRFSQKSVTSYRPTLASDIEEMLPRLSGTCCIVRSMVHTRKINTLQSIYCAFFHSIIQYGIFFGDNSSNSGKIFTLQKKKQEELWLVLHSELHVKVYLNN
jgi:hypothetical protein